MHEGHSAEPSAGLNSNNHTDENRNPGSSTAQNSNRTNNPVGPGTGAPPPGNVTAPESLFKPGRPDAIEQWDKVISSLENHIERDRERKQRNEEKNKERQRLKQPKLTKKERGEGAWCTWKGEEKELLDWVTEEIGGLRKTIERVNTGIRGGEELKKEMAKIQKSKSSTVTDGTEAENAESGANSSTTTNMNQNQMNLNQVPGSSSTASSSLQKPAQSRAQNLQNQNQSMMMSQKQARKLGIKAPKQVATYNEKRQENEAKKEEGRK